MNKADYFCIFHKQKHGSTRKPFVLFCCIFSRRKWHKNCPTLLSIVRQWASKPSRWPDKQVRQPILGRYGSHSVNYFENTEYLQELFIKNRLMCLRFRFVLSTQSAFRIFWMRDRRGPPKIGK